MLSNIKFLSHFSFLFLFFTFSFLFSTHVYATTITVNSNQDLGSILRNLTDGDVVKVNTGTYSVPNLVDIDSNNLLIEAVGDVTIQGNNNWTNFANVQGATITISGNNNIFRGFKLTGYNVKTPLRVYGNYNLVEGIEITRTAEDAMWVWGHHNTIRGSYFHDIYDDRCWDGCEEYPDGYNQHVDCFMTWAWSADGKLSVSEDYIIENNICVLDRSKGDNSFFMLTHSNNSVSIKNWTYRNNIFISKDTGFVPLAFFADQSVSGIKVLNNTFYNTTGSASSLVWAGNLPDLTIINNVGIGYNEIVSNDNSSNITNQKNILNPTNLGAYSNYQVNRQSNHGFTISGFTPTPTSNLVDQGSNLTTLGLTSDFFNASRPQGSSFDIGAIELSSLSSTTKPGDLNSDQSIDAHDLTILLSHYGRSLSGTSNGDFDGSGSIDLADYNVVTSHYRQ